MGMSIWGVGASWVYANQESSTIIAYRNNNSIPVRRACTDSTSLLRGDIIKFYKHVLSAQCVYTHREDLSTCMPHWGIGKIIIPKMLILWISSPLTPPSFITVRLELVALERMSKISHRFWFPWWTPRFNFQRCCVRVVEDVFWTEARWPTQHKTTFIFAICFHH